MILAPISFFVPIRPKPSPASPVAYSRTVDYHRSAARLGLGGGNRCRLSTRTSG